MIKLCKIIGHKMMIKGDVSKSQCSRCGFKTEVKWPRPQGLKPTPPPKPPKRQPDLIIEVRNK